MTVATDYLAQLPLSLTFLVIAAVWILIALVMIWIGNRLVPVDVRSLSAGGVLNVLAIVASFYGFLVGFVVVQEWGNVNSAKSQVSQEAASLSTALFTASVLPPPNSVRIINSLLQFGRSEQCVEIPSLASQTRENLDTSHALGDIYQEAAAVRPASVTGLPAFSSLFSAISDVASARRQVVDASTQRIPFALLAVIFVAGLVLLGTVSLQDVRHGRAHLIAVIAVALFIALGQALVVSLSRPFSGAATVSSAPLRDGAPPQFTDCAKSEVLTSVKQLG